MSFLSKLKEAFSKKEDKAQYLAGFQKTNETFGDALSKMEYEFHGCDDDFLEQLTIILLESDVGIETADLICDKLKSMMNMKMFLYSGMKTEQRYSS